MQRLRFLQHQFFRLNIHSQKKAKPVEIDPSQIEAPKALSEGISDGRFNNVSGIMIKALNTIDQPIKTNLFEVSEYFCINTVENA